MSPEAVLQIVATGVVTVLSILGGAAWLDRKIDANGRELRGDMTSLKTDLKAEITAVGDRSETARKQINDKVGNLEVGQVALTERMQCVDDKVDSILRRFDEK